MGTNDARSLPPGEKQELRYRAVKAVISGIPQVEVANMFRVTRQAVGRWVKAYREGGMDALNSKRKGRPTGGSLNHQYEELIYKIIFGYCPNQLQIPSYLWTREVVRQLIKDKAGVNLSIWTVSRYLKKWGIIPQKIDFRDFSQKRA